MFRQAIALYSLAVFLFTSLPSQAASPSALSYVGTTANTVAAGNDARIKVTAPQALFYVAFGDSISAGCCTTVSGNTWVNLLATALGLTATNKSISGSLIQDTFPQIYPTSVSDIASQLFSVGIGTNEGTFSGTDTRRTATFQSEHQAALAWLATPSRSKVIGQSTTTTVSVSSITSVAASAGANVAGQAAVTTSSAHGFVTGQGITIAGATPTAYNITAPIIVTGANTFTFYLSSNPGVASGTITATSPAITYAGSWAKDAADYNGTMSQVSNTNGSTATFSCFGPTCYVAYGLAVGDGGTLSITVDGTLYGTYASGGVGGIGFFTSPVVGVNHGSALARLSGLANTIHSVVIAVTSSTGASNNVWIDWVGQPGGSTYFAGPTVVSVGPPRNAANDNAQAYAILEQQDVGLLAGDGLNVLYADSAGNTSPGADLNPDGTHPTDQGHRHMFEAVYSVLNSASTARAKSAALAVNSVPFLGQIIAGGAAFGNRIVNCGTGDNILGGGFGGLPNTMNGCGNNNTIAGGQGNVVGGGGTNNTNSNFIGAGNQNTIQFGGQNAIVSGALNAVQGFYNIIGGGQNNSVLGTYSGILSGLYGADRARYGWQGLASGRFAALGDAQFGQQVLRASVSGSATGRATADGAAAGSANCVNLPTKSAYAGRVTAVAFDTTTFDAASWVIDNLLAVRGTGNVSIVGAPTVTKQQATSGASGWSLAAPAADTTNQCLTFNVTGATGANMHLVLHEMGPEVQ